MAFYWVKTPEWFKKLYPHDVIWEIQNTTEPSVYITFDDGPHPLSTAFALEQLKKYNAKATFFCVGNNVSRCPEIYADILSEGHSTGNHTFDHINGWKTKNLAYIDNIEKARKYIDSDLFRPPYGRISLSQIRKLRQQEKGWKIIMWSLLSADFDKNITPEQCLNNVLTNIKPGSIVIFHDSAKAWERMRYALPRVLEYCKKKNWNLKSIPV